MNYRQEGRNDVRIKYVVGKNNSLPMVHVILGHKKYYPTVALVDSGAQISVITKTVADAIGIKLPTKIDTMLGPGGNFQIYTCKINKIVLTKDRVVLNELINPTVRVPLVDNLDFSILGRDTIFKKYKIRFEENDQQFWLIQ